MQHMTMKYKDWKAERCPYSTNKLGRIAPQESIGELVAELWVPGTEYEVWGAEISANVFLL